MCLLLEWKMQPSDYETRLSEQGTTFPPLTLHSVYLRNSRRENCLESLTEHMLDNTFSKISLSLWIVFKQLIFYMKDSAKPLLPKMQFSYVMQNMRGLLDLKQTKTAEHIFNEWLIHWVFNLWWCWCYKCFIKALWIHMLCTVVLFMGWVCEEVQAPK